MQSSFISPPLSALPPPSRHRDPRAPSPGHSRQLHRHRLDQHNDRPHHHQTLRSDPPPPPPGPPPPPPPLPPPPPYRALPTSRPIQLPTTTTTTVRPSLSAAPRCTLNLCLNRGPLRLG